MTGRKRIKTPAIIANPIGRPSLFKEAAPKIIKYIREGNNYECAASCARVTYHSFNNWMKKGEQDEIEGNFDSEYFHFFQDVKQAETDCEKEVLSYWKKAMPDNWQAAKEYLRLRHPDKWIPKEKLEVNSTIEVSQKTKLEIPDNNRRDKKEYESENT